MDEEIRWIRSDMPPANSIRKLTSVNKVLSTLHPLQQLSEDPPGYSNDLSVVNPGDGRA